MIPRGVMKVTKGIGESRPKKRCRTSPEEDGEEGEEGEERRGKGERGEEERRDLGTRV